LLVAVAGAFGYFGGMLREQGQFVSALVGALALVALGWFLPLCAWLARNYTITTRRIVLRSGVFVRVRQELLHSRGVDVSVRKTPLQRLFGSGDVAVNVATGRPIVLKDIPGADLVQSALADLMEAGQAPLLASSGVGRSA
jgi:membrane protein YdbS with pleckstrin-like domain